jgi:hypothetical protein
MQIVMTRNTLWQNLMIRIGEEFTASDEIGTALVRRGVARDKNAPAPAPPVIPTKDKKVEKPEKKEKEKKGGK